MNDDLISRKALKEALLNRLWDDEARIIEIVEEEIDNAPTVERIVCRSRHWSNECTHSSSFEQGYVQGYEEGKNNRPKGKWRSVGFEKGYAFCICSNCGNTTRLYRDSKNEFCCIADIRNKVIACLYCGADMRSVDKGLHERAVCDLSKTVDDLYKKLRGEA